MPRASDANVRKRIEKDMESFYANLGSTAAREEKSSKVIELAKMYASDAKSYLDKGDLYTSFSCISYAHGLLDAVKEMVD